MNLVWTRERVALAAPAVGASQFAVIGVDGAVRWLDEQSGKVLLRARHKLNAHSDEYLAATRERVMLARRTGRLSVISARGSHGSCRLSSAPLLPLRYDAPHDQLIVTAGDGSVAGVRFDRTWE